MRKDKLEISELIRSKYNKLSNKQRNIAEFILNNLQRCSDLSSNKLADLLGVNESTIVRFSQKLDLSSYKDLARLISESSKTESTTLERIEISKINNNIISTTYLTEINSIKNIPKNIDLEQYNKIIDHVLNAKKIYILGCRSSSFLAGYLSYYLSMVYENITLLGNKQINPIEEIKNISNEDVLFVISYPRYTSESLKIVKYANKKNANIICLTNNDSNPLLDFSTNFLAIENNMIFFIDSIATPIVVLNAIILDICLHNKQQTINCLSELENLWLENNIFIKKD